MNKTDEEKKKKISRKINIDEERKTKEEKEK